MTGPPAFRPGEAPGPQGTPSTFRGVTSTTAPRHQAPCAPGEAPPAALPPAAGPATPRQTPGPPSGHPAPTSEGASPLGVHPNTTPPGRLPAPHPPRDPGLLPAGRRPVPVSPEPRGLPSSVAPPPTPAPPAPSPRGHPALAAPALRTEPRRPRPSPCLRRSWRAHTRCSSGPPPALRAARRRLLQPGTRRDIRARIPTPGLFLGARPGPDRNSFLPARVRTAQKASVSLRQPRLSVLSPRLPVSFLPHGSLSEPLSPRGGPRSTWDGKDKGAG